MASVSDEPLKQDRPCRRQYRARHERAGTQARASWARAPAACGRYVFAQDASARAVAASLDPRLLDPRADPRSQSACPSVLSEVAGYLLGLCPCAQFVDVLVLQDRLAMVRAAGIAKP